MPFWEPSGTFSFVRGESKARGWLLLTVSCWPSATDESEGEEDVGVGADSGFSGTSNAMLEKKIFTHDYGIQACDAGRVYGLLSRCIPQHLPKLWN